MLSCLSGVFQSCDFMCVLHNMAKSVKWDTFHLLLPPKLGRRHKIGRVVRIIGRLGTSLHVSCSVDRYSVRKAIFTRSFLRQENAQGIIQAKTSSEYLYVVVSTVDDRSILSDEMAVLCAKLPIYRLKEKSLMPDVDKENHLQRKFNTSEEISTYDYFLSQR